MKPAVLLAFATGVVALALWAAPARAASEFCPARLIGTYTKTLSKSGTIVHYYRLQALAPRSVEGTIIAETDHGWYSWPQQLVELRRVTYDMADGIRVRFVMAESPELSVAFPQPLNVLRAWVALARTHGDQIFKWDERGMVLCDPADFAGYGGRSKSTRAVDAGDPTPAPPPPAALATATDNPFPNAKCDHPFTAARVWNAIRPDFPDFVRNMGLSQAVTSVVYVAVDPNGKLSDAWLFGSSGYPALDKAAITAAKRSSYTAAKSYCRSVGGVYLFRADFEPY